MIAVQKIANVWAVVRLSGAGEVVTVIRSFRQQGAAHRLLMKLYAGGAV